jgi:hypothetical protein
VKWARVSTICLLFASLAIAVSFMRSPLFVSAAETGFSVALDGSKSQPRRLEETTMISVQRDYSHAWRSMAAALEENKLDLLDQDFVGVAKDKLTQSITQQRALGLKRRYIDHGHQLEVIFYSVDGSAMEVQDTARLEIQELDGDKLVHSEQGTFHFLAVLTPAENSWKVRLLESVSGH